MEKLTTTDLMFLGVAAIACLPSLLKFVVLSVIRIIGWWVSLLIVVHRLGKISEYIFFAVLSVSIVVSSSVIVGREPYGFIVGMIILIVIIEYGETAVLRKKDAPLLSCVEWLSENGYEEDERQQVIEYVDRIVSTQSYSLLGLQSKAKTFQLIESKRWLRYKLISEMQNRISTSIVSDIALKSKWR